MFAPSPEQNNFFDWVKNGEGNCVLEAVAGSGKTTTILHAISKMKGKVWFGVYNRKMAEEIKEKVSSFPELKNRPFPHEMLDTSTFHSLGFSMIKFYNGKNSTIVDEFKVKNIINQIIFQKEAEDQMRRDDLRSIATLVNSVVSMAKNRGFVDNRSGYLFNMLYDINNDDDWIYMINHFDFEDTIPDINMKEFIDFCRLVLITSNKSTTVIDMDDMVYLPVAFSSIKVGYRSYNWVLIDEAQDTNPTRRALARKIMARGARLVAVGDPRQAIFGFTGADNDSLQQIKRTFNAITLPLSVTYRCPRSIVAHAQTWVSHIVAHPSAPNGILRTIDFKSILDELKEIDRENHKDVSILCRYNKELVRLCFSMIRDGIPARIEGRAIGEGLLKLAKKWKSIKNINILEDKLRDYMDKEIKKAIEKEQEDKAERIKDQVETLCVIIDRARNNGITHVDDLSHMIVEMFDDGVSNKGIITLCSVHRSKGLEWNKVYILGRSEFMPSKMATQEWQIDQEMNLIYVALTRSRCELIEVINVG